MKTHKLIFVNSENRQAAQSINDITLQINDPEIVGKNVYVYLVNFVSRICIPVIDSTNNIFTLNENGTTASITITSNQSPDWNSLASELQTLLTAASPNHYTYTVTTNKSKLHFIFSCSSSNPVSFDFNVTNSCYKLLGFEKTSYSFSSKSLESSLIVDLGGSSSFFIKIKNGVSNNIEDITNKPSNTLSIVPNLAPYGANLFFHNINDDYCIKILGLSMIEIQLTDFYGNLLTFNSNYILTLKIEIIEDETTDKQLVNNQSETNKLLKLLLLNKELKGEDKKLSISNL